MSHKNPAPTNDEALVVTKIFHPLSDADLDRDAEFYRAFAIDFSREAITVQSRGDDTSNPSAR